MKWLIGLIPTLAFSQVGIEKGSDFVAGEFLVGVKNKSKSIHAVLGQKSLKSYESLKDLGGGVYLLKLKDQKRMAIEFKELQFNPDVFAVEPNLMYYATGLKQEMTPNDEFYGDLWGITNTGQIMQNPTGETRSGEWVRVPVAGVPGMDSNVKAAWDAGHMGSESMVVAVIDTGVDLDHPDLAANIWVNEDEIAGNGIDDDGNGFVDDINGWNFVRNSNNPDDDNNHGTHCAGTIAAIGNNGVGVIGVAPNVKIMAAKFLSAQGGGSLEGAIGAIRYATRNGAKILSNSWGGGMYSEILEQAIRESEAAGAMFIAAAGNSTQDNDRTPSYPSGYNVDNITAVAALDNTGNRAFFTSYGATTVDLGAPGVEILSSIKDGGYEKFMGTSMATPHVSGVAALVWGAHPEETAAQIKARILASATPVNSLIGKTLFPGMVNAKGAIDGVVSDFPIPSEEEWVDIEFTAESEHPYANNTNSTFQLPIPENAEFFRIVFERLEVEYFYDKLEVLNGEGVVLQKYDGNRSNFTTETFNGNTGTLRLVSDHTVNRWGFKVSKLQYVPRAEVPVEEPIEEN